MNYSQRESYGMMGVLLAKALYETFFNHQKKNQEMKEPEYEKPEIDEDDQLSKCMKCPYGPNAKEPPPPFFGKHPCFECDK